MLEQEEANIATNEFPGSLLSAAFRINDCGNTFSCAPKPLIMALVAAICCTLQGKN
jgi:hypothetical protein